MTKVKKRHTVYFFKKSDFYVVSADGVNFLLGIAVIPFSFHGWHITLNNDSISQKWL